MILCRDWRITALLVGLVACTPTLDWREVHPQSGALTALFPCRPVRRERVVPIGAESVRMELLACAAGGNTYALGSFEVADPAAIGTAIAALRSAAIGNIGGSVVKRMPFAISGMAPDAEAGRFVFAGHFPNGDAVQEHAAFFVSGRRIYQASVVGATPTPDAVETFVSGLKFGT